MSQSQEAVADQHRDRQTPASMAYRTPTHSTRMSVDTSSRTDRQTVGWLLYQLSGLLALQSLYSSVIQENTKIKAQKEAHSSNRVKDQLRRNTVTSGESESPESAVFARLDVSDASKSLFSPLYRSMELRLARCEQMMAGAEGMNARGCGI